jgi:hypothetical protein
MRLINNSPMEIMRYVDETLAQPFMLPRFLKTELPDATKWRGGLIYVTDETGGEVPAFSDALVWRRVTDRNQVS